MPKKRNKVIEDRCSSVLKNMKHGRFSQRSACWLGKSALGMRMLIWGLAFRVQPNLGDLLDDTFVGELVVKEYS